MKITACEVSDFRVPPGAETASKKEEYAMRPGGAWAEVGSRLVACTVDDEVCKKAQYTWKLAWQYGQIVAEFKVGESLYYQPIVPLDKPRIRIPMKNEPEVKQVKRADTTTTVTYRPKLVAAPVSEAAAEPEDVVSYATQTQKSELQQYYEEMYGWRMND